MWESHVSANGSKTNPRSPRNCLKDDKLVDLLNEEIIILFWGFLFNDLIE